MRAYEIRETLRALGVRPRRERGQSFLLDEAIAQRIADQAELSKEDVVLEIGPGLGILTEPLLRRAGQVVAVEVDARLCEAVKSRLSSFGNLTLINSDILKLDLSKLPGGERSGRLRVVSNLPYHITSPVLDYIIRNRALIELAVLTLQDEVAKRTVCGPGSKEYGILSVVVQNHTRPEALFSIEPPSFYPSPRVRSTVVRLRMRAFPAISINEGLLSRLLKAAFSQRRKMLKNALRRSFPSEMVEHLSFRCKIDLRRRAETLSLSEFGQLAKALSRLMNACPSSLRGD